MVTMSKLKTILSALIKYKIDPKADKSDIVQSNYEENDSTSNAYIQHRPFYTNNDGTVIPLKSKYLPEGMKMTESASEESGEIFHTLGLTGDVIANSTSENPISLTETEDRVTKHEKRYRQKEFMLTDGVTDCDYIVKMQDGNLIYYKKCIGIKVTSLPTNTNVIDGGLLDTTGMIITAICQDYSEREITDYKLSPVTSSPAIITYEELDETYSVSIDINIVPVEEALVDFNYTNNGDGTCTITSWKGTLNGESSTRLIVPNSNKVII